MPLVHAELKRIARRCLRGERKDHTLQATALVNEAYLRMVNVQDMNWQNRAHFLAMAARLMRRILVDSARARGYQKRDAGALRISYSEDLAVADETSSEVVKLDDALDALAKLDERKSLVVELRFFGGLSVAEAATVIGVSEETVMRDWKAARAWLLKEMKNDRRG